MNNKSIFIYNERFDVKLKVNLHLKKKKSPIHNGKIDPLF